VVWYGDAWPYEIFFYNGTTTVQITDNSTADSNPEIDGLGVVWQCDDGSDDEICYWNGSDVIKLTDNTIDDSAPSISGSTVVWSGYDGNDTEVFMTDITDTDGDGVFDSEDNCTLAANQNQVDTDSDDCGNQCDADFDQNGAIDIGDFGLFAAVYGTLVPPTSQIYDIAGNPLNGAVDIGDFGRFQQLFG
jgi:hypothetical protein